VTLVGAVTEHACVAHVLTVGVIVIDQPPAMLPESLAESSRTYRLQAPFAAWPAKADASVSEPHLAPTVAPPGLRFGPAGAGAPKGSAHSA